MSNMPLHTRVLTATHLVDEDAPEARYNGACAIEAMIAKGHRVDAKTLRDVMETAFGASDAAGAWVWKDAYDVCEAGMTLFIRKYGKAMGDQAKTPLALLAMFDRLAQLLPTHTRRTEESEALQQFSTPLGIALAVAVAGAVTDDDVVLEPSAGLGLLPAVAGVRGARLALNEISPSRKGLLDLMFPGSLVTSLDGAQIDDRLDQKVRPTVVLMNPPFSATLNVRSRVQGTAMRHITSALARLAPGGRLVAITGEGQGPHSPAWRGDYVDLQNSARVVFTQGIEARAFAKNGTTFPTRITVIDKIPAEDPAVFPAMARTDTVAAIVARLLEVMPPRAEVLVNTGPRRVVEMAKPAGSVGSWLAARNPPRTARRPRDPAAPITYAARPQEAPAAITARDEIYVPYATQTIQIEGAQAHPTALVQSQSMASVAPPAPTYRPCLPARVVTEGLLSDVQLESVIYAGEAHGEFLPGYWDTDLTFDTLNEVSGDVANAVQFRRGWFLGDGTGAGKGRQGAGIILDNWEQGRRKAVWVSKSDKLIEDAMRDWSGVGQERLLVTPQSRFKLGHPIAMDQGILFTTYATLRSQSRDGKGSRIAQILDWLGADFDGVILFDESHAMANAAGGTGNRGAVSASQQGRAGLRLQHALPSARVVYVSATGATEVRNLAYAQRLGLWGGRLAPFNTREDFVTAITEGGVAAMEVLARDLKSMGHYAARSLSYEGVEYELLIHDLTAPQVEIYDAYADAFNMIHHNLDAALEATGVTCDGETLDSQAYAQARSTFEGCKQRFFSHLITGMKVPSLLAAIRRDIENGDAPVVQVVSTGEALMERRLAEMRVEDWDDLKIDITPREYVLDYLMHAFPTQLFEPFETEDGDILARPVTDDKGNIVQSQEALRARDHAIEQLAMLPPVPGALDQLIQTFGDETIAEVTGRTRRIIRKGDRLCVQNRSASANLAEAQAFMDDTKQILVFSDAGGTGRSYHADLAVKNRRKRIHYLLEPGWKADAAIQGLGRTNRTNQAQPPLFRPVTTNVKGERRFISTIARRLDTLGAITKGQRQTGGQGLFRPEDNLESDYAKAALRQLYTLIVQGKIDGCSLRDFQDATALNLMAEDGGMLEDLPPITQFLNRLLALRIAMQNLISEAFEGLLTARIEAAQANGSFDRGLETIVGDSISITNRETIYQHPGARTPTELLAVRILEPLNPTSLADALNTAALYEGILLVNTKSRRAGVQITAPQMMLDDGSVQRRARIVRPTERSTISYQDLAESNWTQTTPQVFELAWNAELQALPAKNEKFMHIVSGLLLPIWKRLPNDVPRVYRFQTDDGETIIGRHVKSDWAEKAQISIEATPCDAGRVWADLTTSKQVFALEGGLELRRAMVKNAWRVELTGASPSSLAGLKAMGMFTEIIAWQTRIFVPTDESGLRILTALLVDHPVIAP